MTAKNFFKKFLSLYLWGNLLAMAAIATLLVLGFKYGLDLYTHHGQTVEVPNVIHKSFNEAEDILDDVHLNIQVSDTDYVKTLPPGCVLEQSPLPGDIVKPGRLVFIKINASHAPEKPIPDVIDNSSLRDCESKLLAMGYKLGDTEFIPGERDWVYGIKCRGKQISTGDKVSIEEVLILQVGDGRRDVNDAVTLMESDVYYYEDELQEDEKPQRTRSHYKRPDPSKAGAPGREELMKAINESSKNVPVVPPPPPPAPSGGD
ncbi:MAG: PASTA domain-containing protein [Prevotella sp.]|nr:PASTA domain-containing protein [Prevotella sp.]